MQLELFVDDDATRRLVGNHLKVTCNFKPGACDVFRAVDNGDVSGFFARMEDSSAIPENRSKIRLALLRNGQYKVIADLALPGISEKFRTTFRHHNVFHRRFPIWDLGSGSGINSISTYAVALFSQKMDCILGSHEYSLRPSEKEAVETARQIARGFYEPDALDYFVLLARIR